MKRKSNILPPPIVVEDMLFDVNPKERKEDLYDRERELNEIFDALKREPRHTLYTIVKITLYVFLYVLL